MVISILCSPCFANVIAMLAARGEKKPENVFLDSNKSSKESLILAREIQTDFTSRELRNDSKTTRTPGFEQETKHTQ